jgi:acyl-CoA reductase-like NAD-dependent aldehyde dehydrogenase
VRRKEIAMNITCTPQIDDVAWAVQACRKQQEQWCRLSVRQRLKPIRALRRLLVAECDALCAAVKDDLGKLADEVIGAEVLPLADACRFLQRQAGSLLGPRRIPLRSRPLWLWGQRDVVHRRPRGVIAIIGTWNYPLLLNGVQIIQALTAGNAVLWKPSEVTPATSAAFARLLGRAGFPADLVRVLPATREAGPLALEADVDHVVFTGSVNVGRQIAARLGQRLVSSTLELSGCDPMFVLPDADVDLAAAAAWFGAVVNRGQTCIAVRRAFVHRSLYAELTGKLEPWTRAARPQQLALPSQARQAEQMVKDAARKGGRLLPGDTIAGDGATTFRPTVILEATPEMQVFREASFAPLLAVLPYDDLEQALEMDRQCPFGLGASIFTRSARQAQAIAARLRTGSVTVNDVIAPTAHPAVPFGGLRQSGWGVTQGAEGLLEMTVPQVVSVRGGTYRPHYELATKGPGEQEGLVRGLLRLCHGSGLSERWHGLRQVIAALRGR